MKTAVISSAVSLALIITNPDPNRHSKFIAQEIKESLCDETIPFSPVQSFCGIITRPVARRIIRESTDRTNLLVLSIYSTHLPFAEFHILGVGSFFFALPTN